MNRQQHPTNIIMSLLRVLSRASVSTPLLRSAPIAGESKFELKRAKIRNAKFVVVAVDGGEDEWRRNGGNGS